MRSLRGILAVGVAASSLVWGDVQAQEPEEAEVGVTEILVTAQRRSENVQKIPVAVATLGSEELKAANIETALDINMVEPSAQVASSAGTVTVFLRGVGNAFQNAGSEASAPVYVDGVYFSRLSPILMRLNNIERIEVAKGPQGTLFGRAASAGLVNIITSDPSPGQELELKGSVGIGSDSTADGSLYLATGLGSHLAADLALVLHDQSGGWGRNLFDGSPTYTDSARAIRSKWVADLGDSLTVTLAADYSRGKSGQGLGTGARPSKIVPQLIPLGFQQGVAGYPDPLVLPDKFHDRNEDGKNEVKSVQWGGSLRIEREFDFATFVSTTAYHNLKQRWRLDTDSSPLNVYNIYLPSYSKDLSQELQLVSKSGGSLDWILGFFYLDGDQGYTPVTLTGSLFDSAVGPGGEINYFGSQKVKSYALYAQGSYAIFDDTKITLGLRHTQDRVAIDGYAGGVIVGVGFVEFPGTRVDTSRKSGQWTWKAALDHQITDDVMVYASVSRGYKPGTYNLIPAGPDYVKPEVNTAYEAGLKSEWFDRRLRVNGALFWYDLKNPQVQVNPVPGAVALQNAPAARVRGAELEIDAMLADNFSLSAGLTVLDAEYTNFPNAPGFTINPTAPFGYNPPTPIDAKGNRMVQAPELTATAGFNYTADLGNAGELRFSGNFSYNDGFFWNADNLGRQSAYGLLNGQIAYTFADKPITVRLWGSNLTDSEYYVSASEANIPQVYLAAPGAPRMFGLAVDFEL